MRITSNIFQIGGSMESHPSDASIYLIKDGSRCAVIDAGTGGDTDAVLSNMRECGVDPSSVAVHTHHPLPLRSCGRHKLHPQGHGSEGGGP